MSRTAKTVTTLALLLLLGGLAAADAWYGTAQTADVTGGSSSPEPTDSGGATTDPGTGVAPGNGISYEEAAARQGVTLVPTERVNSVIAPFVGNMRTASFSLLLNGDRAGSLFCADGGGSKEALIAIKEALVPVLSDKVTGLIDETTQEDGKPVINRVAFVDPAISREMEKITIVRSRTRLCEMRALPGAEGTLDEFLHSLMTEYAA
jgi:hypothetical protein